MSFAKALALAIGFHLLLAAGIGLYLTYAPGPDVLVQLDLSSVELSFAEEESETAPVAPLPPASELPPPEPPPPDCPPPEVEPLPELPPDPEALALPEPEPERAELPPPEREERVSEKKPPEENRPEPSVETPPAPSVAPRQARVDAPPAPKRAIRPEYPKGSRQRGEQGDVVVEIRVDGDGRVSGASVATSSGFAELDAAALKAVKGARFTPAKAGGRSVASTARLTLSFRLK